MKKIVLSLLFLLIHSCSFAGEVKIQQVKIPTTVGSNYEALNISPTDNRKMHLTVFYEPTSRVLFLVPSQGVSYKVLEEEIRVLPQYEVALYQLPVMNPSGLKMTKKRLHIRVSFGDKNISMRIRLSDVVIEQPGGKEYSYRVLRGVYQVNDINEDNECDFDDALREAIDHELYATIGTLSDDDSDSELVKTSPSVILPQEIMTRS